MGILSTEQIQVSHESPDKRMYDSTRMGHEGGRTYDPIRQDPRFGEERDYYKEFGMAMSKSQENVERSYKDAIQGMGYAPVTDFDKAYQEWYASGDRPQVYKRPGDPIYATTEWDTHSDALATNTITKVGDKYYSIPGPDGYALAPFTSIPQYDVRVIPEEIGLSMDGGELLLPAYTQTNIDGNWYNGDLRYSAPTELDMYIPKDQPSATVISYLTSPTLFQDAFKTEWFKTAPAAYNESNEQFYTNVASLDAQKAEVYKVLGVKTTSQLYLDPSNDYDKTVIGMQGRFEKRILDKHNTLSKLFA